MAHTIVGNKMHNNLLFLRNCTFYGTWNDWVSSK